MTIEALAANDLGQEAFTQIIADLLYLPGMRPPLFAKLCNPERSAASGQGGAMFSTQL
jgi:hypothetical protein